MKNSILITLLVTSQFSNAQTKVASFSSGKYGTKDYEHFSFWEKDGKRAEIEYTYGADRKDIVLKYVGASVYKGDSCFKVQFPNIYILYIIPTGINLKVTDENGKYLKIYSWEYEGPVNGIGTFCEICVENEVAAMELLRLNYLR